MGKYNVDDVEVSPSNHERELKERQRIVDECPIDVYCSSINPRWGYPNKLMSYWEARGTVADSATSVIIDSGFRRYGELDQILDEAERHEADWVIPPDITPHFYCYDEISGESRARELARHLTTVLSRRDSASYDLDANVLLPVHRPIDANLEWLSNPDVLETWSAYDEYDGGLLDVFDGVAIGLKAMPVDERIQALVTLNERTPQGTHVHGLSPGTEIEMLGFLRENPHMLDSLDVSTPENAAKNNKIPDNTWTQHMVPFPSGTDITTLRAVRSIEIALRLNFALSPLCNDDEFSELARTWKQHGPAIADD